MNGTAIIALILTAFWLTAIWYFLGWMGVISLGSLIALAIIILFLLGRSFQPPSC